MAPATPSFPRLIDASIADLSRGLSTGLFGVVDLVRAYTARIAEVNDRLHAVIEINPDALGIAAALDRERAAARAGPRSGEPNNGLPPLHGMPILLKDTIATHDEMSTASGSTALVGARVAEDSAVAARLRRAGAVLLGKANVSEFGCYRSLGGIMNGWSGRGGQGLGPYYPNQDPSGSSSGSAVAATLGLAAACVGGETSGSIISPAGINNLVGLKPTVGLVSRHLVIPVSHNFDTLGPMARSVRDAALLLDAMAGRDPRDSRTLQSPFASDADIPSFSAAAASGRSSRLRGIRVGVPRAIFDSLRAESGVTTRSLQPVMAAFDAALDEMRAAGAEVVDGVHMPGFVAVQGSPLFDELLVRDFVADLAQYLAQLAVNPQGIKSLADLCAFTQGPGREAEEWPGRDTAVWEYALRVQAAAAAQGGGGEADADTATQRENLALAQHIAGPLGITGALDKYRLDALVMPSYWSPLVAAILGAPVVNLPLGAYPERYADDDSPFPPIESQGGLVERAPGIPFGICFVGSPWKDEQLIRIAAGFEEKVKVRESIKPYIEPKTEVAVVME